MYNFAEANKFAEVIVALAVLNDVPVEMIARLLEGPRSDLILIPCRSGRLNWPTVEASCAGGRRRSRIDEQTLEVAQRDYRKLSMETAQRTDTLLAASQPDREVAVQSRGNLCAVTAREV